MSEKKEDTLVSLSGSPIYRHGQASAWEAPQGEESVEQIGSHIDEHLGRTETVFHEIISDAVHIDVHFVKPSDKSPVVRLVTSGMSDRPMTTPSGVDVPRYAELLISLPPHWKLDQESLKDEAWYWPIRLLKVLARLPHKHSTWLGWGHTVPNGDPPEPYSTDSGLSGAILLPSVTVPDGFHTLVISPQKTITFYAVVPLYAPEMTLKLRSGSDALLKKLGSGNVNDIVNPARRDVTRKRFGIF
jgi:Suppressor of fused protein (SUFU)